MALLRLLLGALSAGDEGRQPFDVLFASLRDVLRARLRVLRLHLRMLLLARIRRLRLAWRKRLAADRGLLVVAVVVAGTVVVLVMALFPSLADQSRSAAD